MPDAPAPAAKPAAQVIPAAAPDAASTLGLQVVVVVVVALYFAREVLIPITLAILLAFILAPVVALLRRTRLGRVPAVLLAVVAALAIILGLGGVIGTQVAQLATGIPQYAATVESKIDAVRAYTTGRMASFAGRLGLPGQPPAAGPARAASAPGVPGTNLIPAPPAAVPVAPEPGSSPLALAERYLSPVLSPLATMGIVFVVAIFALLQQEDLRDRLIRLFGATDLHRTTVALDDAARRLAKYLLTQACGERELWPGDRRRALCHRRAQPGAVGDAVGAAALCALYRVVHLGRAAAGAGCRGQPRLDDGDLDRGPLRRR